jgi:nucleoid DNA-binding protein
LFSHELTREVSRRTSLNLATVNYIMDTYKDVILEHLDQGKKVELERIGTIVFKVRKSYFCQMVGRTIPDRYLPRFIFKPSLQSRIRKRVTVDVIPSE